MCMHDCNLVCSLMPCLLERQSSCLAFVTDMRKVVETWLVHVLSLLITQTYGCCESLLHCTPCCGAWCSTALLNCATSCSCVCGAGLVGPLAIYAKGKLDEPGVDKEIPLFFGVMNEMQSVYFKVGWLVSSTRMSKHISATSHLLIMRGVWS